MRVRHVSWAVLLLVAPYPAWAADPAERVDLYGDPLPVGTVARLGTARFRTGGQVGWLGYTPDGKALAFAGPHTPLTLLDAATGRELRRFPPDPPPGEPGPASAAFSPDGTLLAAPAADGTVRVWEIAPGKLRQELVGRKGDVTSLAFSPDGNTLAAGGTDKVVVLWAVPRKDGDGWKEARRLDHGGQVLAVAFSPDGKALAAGGQNGHLLSWDPGTGDQSLDVRETGARLFSVTFSPDGKTVAAATDQDDVVLWDAVTGKEVGRCLDGSGPLAFSPDGTALAVGADPVILGRKITRWSGRILRLRPGKGLADKGPHCPLAFSPDGKNLAVTFQGAAIRRYDTASWQPLAGADGPESPLRCVAVSPDGGRVATGRADGTVSLWDAATGKELCPDGGRGHQGEVNGVAFSPDGKTVASAGIDGTVRLWDADGLKGLRQLKAHGPGVAAVAFSPGGAVLVSGGLDGVVRPWSATTGDAVSRWAARSAITALAFSPDGKWAVAADRCVGGGGDRARGGRLYVWGDQDNRGWAFRGDPDQVLDPGEEGKRADVRAMAVSPDRRTVAAGDSDGVLRLWDLNTGQCRRRVEASPGAIVSLGFSPDGRLLAGCADEHSGGGPGGLFLWETATLGEVRRLTGHRGTVESVAFFPDGQRVVAAGSDTSALVYDVRPPARWPADGPSAKEQEAAWQDLASDDAAKAYRAVWELGRSPRVLAPLVRKRIAAFEAELRQVEAKIADLDDNQFRVREQAQAELIDLGDRAEPALRKVLDGQPSLEVKRRVTRILERLEDAEPTPERLRWLRAVAALEQAGDPETRAVLEDVARGPLGEAPGRAARAVLGRTVKP
jgi:WD40 repeat protein